MSETKKNTTVGEEENLIKRWEPVLSKCGNLTTDQEKVFLINTLETFRKKAVDAVEGQSRDLVLGPGKRVNVFNPEKTTRIVVQYDESGMFAVTRQRKDWVDEQ
jgi:hypothetical protein